MKDIKITGSWDGEPIWREKTPEEKLEEVDITPTQALACLALISKNERLSQDHIDNCNGCALCEI